MKELTFVDIVVLFKKRLKVFIAIVTICTLIGYLVSSFVLPKEYESSFSCMVLQSNFQSQKPEAGSLINPVNLFSLKDAVITYANLLKSKYFQNLLIKKLKEEFNIDISDLEDIISVKIPNNTNLLQISVVYKDPEISYKIAEIASKEFLNYVDEIKKGNLYTSFSELESQFLKIKNKLSEVQKKINELKYGPENPDDLEAEKSGYLTQYSSLVKKKSELNAEISNYYSKKRKAEELVKSFPMKIVLKRSIIDDPLMTDLAKEISEEDLILLMKLQVETEALNPAYTSVISSLNTIEISLSGLMDERKQLEEEIENMRKKVESLNKVIVEKQNELSKLEQEKNLLEKEYDVISQSYLSSLIIKNYYIPDIVLVSYPTLPHKPIRPDVLLNTLASFLLGIILATLFIFLRR